MSEWQHLVWIWYYVSRTPQSEDLSETMLAVEVRPGPHFTILTEGTKNPKVLFGRAAAPTLWFFRRLPILM